MPADQINHEAQTGQPEAALDSKQVGQLQTGFQELFSRLNEPRVVAGPQHLLSGSLPDCVQFGYSRLDPSPERSAEMDEAICLVFCRRLIERVKEIHRKTGNLTSPEGLYWMNRVYEEFCNPQQCDFTSYLSTVELMKFTREFTQIPSAYQSIGKHATNQVSKRLEESSPEDIPTLATELRELPHSERIDLAQLFPTLARNLSVLEDRELHAQLHPVIDRIGHGRQSAIQTLQTLIGELHDKTENAMARIALRTAEKRSIAELVPTIHEHGLTTRIHETESEQAQRPHDQLARSIRLNILVQHNERLVPISNDAVGILTPTGTIRHIATYDPSTLSAPAPFHATALDDIRNRLDRGLINSLLYEKIDDEVIAPLDGDIDRDTFWTSVFKGTNGNVSPKCLADVEKERTLRRVGGEMLLREARVNLTERASAMQHYADEIYTMLPELRADPVIGEYSVYLDRFEYFYSLEVPSEDGQSTQQGIPHQAMMAIDNLLAFAKIPNDTSAALRHHCAYLVPDASESPLLSRVVTLCNEALREDRHISAEFKSRQSAVSQDYQTKAQNCALSLTTIKEELGKDPARGQFLQALDQLEERYLKELPVVDVRSTEEFLATTELYPFTAEQKKDEDIAAFALLHSPEVRNSVQEQLGVAYSEMSLQSQFHLIRFLNTRTPEQFDEAADVIRRHADDPETRANLLTSFFACAEDSALGETILKITEADGSAPVFQAYARLTNSAAETSRMLTADMQQRNSGNALSSHDLYRSLLRRGNDLLRHAGRIVTAGKDIPDQLAAIAQQLEDESAQISVARTFFTDMTQALRSGEQIDLSAYAASQQFIVDSLQEAGANASLLRVLHNQDKLAPIPHIYWRVDRTAEEYEERFGFDVVEFLSECASDDKQQLLVEFGPGNGTFKQHRSEATKDYLDVAICDRLYYPVATFLQNVVDFDALKAAGADLSHNQQKELCKFLYRILVIGEDQYHLDTPANDETVMNSLTENPNTITAALASKAHLLTTIDTVPGDARRNENGEYIYTQKMPRPSGEPFDTALRLLGSQTEAYLRTANSDVDAYELLPAYPAGTIVSDFSDVEHLADKQIGVGLGLRSTVYKEEQEYQDFMTTMTTKLTDDGIYIDDNIRDNFGVYYRLQELQQVEAESDYELMVITGPKVEDSDRCEERVPRAVVMSRSADKLARIREKLASKPGFALEPLDVLIADSEYIQRLKEADAVHQSLLAA